MENSFHRLSAANVFISSGLFFGLLTEVWAIYNNLHLPPGEKALLHPDPVADIILGLIWYGLFMITWYVLVREISFSKKAVFIISGIFGVLTEQFTVQNGSAIFLGIFRDPVEGLLLAILVACVYGIFPTLAYMLAEKRFDERRRPKYWNYPIALVILILFWALYGNFVHPIMLTIFPKGY